LPDIFDSFSPDSLDFPSLRFRYFRFFDLFDVLMHGALSPPFCAPAAPGAPQSHRRRPQTVRKGVQKTSAKKRTAAKDVATVKRQRSRAANEPVCLFCRAVIHHARRNYICRRAECAPRFARYADTPAAPAAVCRRDIDVCRRPPPRCPPSA